MLITKTYKKDEVVLKKVPCIYYPFRFHKNKKNEVEALINLSSKVNSITLTYIVKLGLKVHFTDVKAQKIDGFMF